MSNLKSLNLKQILLDEKYETTNFKNEEKNALS